MRDAVAALPASLTEEKDTNEKTERNSIVSFFANYSPKRIAAPRDQ